MKVLVCGGRDYNDADFVYGVLDHVNKKRPITLIIHGDARGADSLARAWAFSRGIPHLPFPADWNRYNHRAGPVRNHQMLREGKPDFVVAFPGGSGTAHMVRIAKEADLPVLNTRKFLPL